LIVKPNLHWRSFVVKTQPIATIFLAPWVMQYKNRNTSFRYLTVTMEPQGKYCLRRFEASLLTNSKTDRVRWQPTDRLTTHRPRQLADRARIRQLADYINSSPPTYIYLYQQLIDS